ncbi:MAG: D-aminoacyl-tRNA deacylase [Clostridia bacterium]
MRVVVCRVDGAECVIDGEMVSKIEKGLLLFVGFGIDDTENDVIKVADKVGKLRIFPDENGKISRSTAEVNGSAMAISNFTLYGRVKSTNRPDFTKSCPGERANVYFELFKSRLATFLPVKSGIFATHMHVSAQNDGPVTLIVDSAEL